MSTPTYMDVSRCGFVCRGYPQVSVRMNLTMWMFSIGAGKVLSGIHGAQRTQAPYDNVVPYGVIHRAWSLRYVT